MTAPAIIGARPEPTPRDRLNQAVLGFQAEQQHVASKMLAAPDPMLNGLRLKLRPALEPMVADFDSQLASVRDAFAGGNGTITHRGFQEQTAQIMENRRATVDAALRPMHDALVAAHEQTVAAIANAGYSATAEDRKAVADLGYELALLTPRHAAPYVEQFLTEALEAKNIGRVAALIILLESLDEKRGSEWHDSPVVRGLSAQATAVQSTWQRQVAETRLARIERQLWELGEVAQAAMDTSERANFRFQMDRLGLNGEDPMAVVPRLPGAKPRTEKPSTLSTEEILAGIAAEDARMAKLVARIPADRKKRLEWLVATYDDDDAAAELRAMTGKK